MKWITLIPTRRNDGSAVSKKELRSIIKMVWNRFSGATIDGPVDGHWVDPRDGKHYSDSCVRVTVVCDAERLADAESLVREIGKSLDQKAMFFEVQYFDGVRFLRTDD